MACLPMMMMPSVSAEDEQVDEQIDEQVDDEQEGGTADEHHW